jgi:hypothetical protein
MILPIEECGNREKELEKLANVFTNHGRTLPYCASAILASVVLRLAKIESKTDPLLAANKTNTRPHTAH